MAIANYGADELKVIGANRVKVHGAFRPNGATGIVSGSVKGRGFSVARTSVGLYTITFDRSYSQLVSCVASARSADGNHIVVVGGDYTAAGTLQLRARHGAPVHVHLPLSAAREIATNDYQALAAHGGLMATDSVPALARVNGATDKAARITWAATEVDEIQWDGIMVPRGAETANAVTVDLAIAKDTNTDTTATVDVQAFAGVGDTEMGSATAALATAALARYSVTLTAANVGAAGANFLNLALVPSAHGTDAILLYGVSATFETLVDLASDADNEVNFECIFRDSGAPY